MKGESFSDLELQEAQGRILELMHRVHGDPAHKARLREELLRRHRELFADHRHSQRAAITLWPHVARLKRLTLVAPPALAVAVAFSVVLFALQVSGHQKTQTAEAARITQAFAHSVPSITTWRWGLHVQRGAERESLQFSATLNRDQALRFYYKGPYLYYRGHWSAVAWDMQRMASIVKPTDWEWAFAILPSLVAGPHAQAVARSTFHGRDVEAFRRVLSTQSGSVSVTAWVDRQNGLVLRLERVLSHENHVVERDVADYTYSPRIR